jgi:hypothetical protein
MKKLFLIAALFAALLVPEGIAQAQTKTFQVTFINHIDVQLHFYVDDEYACTANPGMVCYGTVAVGPHTFKAMQGSTIVRQTEATLYENADNPSWAICYTDRPNC